jgi:hypothetical protein
VISTRVESEFACMRGWQEAVARGALREGIGDTLYIKTLCRKIQSSALLEN